MDYDCTEVIPDICEKIDLDVGALGWASVGTMSLGCKVIGRKAWP